MSDSPSAPAPVDTTGAAIATAQGNLDAARAATQANRVNQYTPYGSLVYSQDPNAATPDMGWSVTQNLSPAQQALLNQQNKTSLGLSSLADQGLGYVRDALGNQINMQGILSSLGSLPASMVNAGQTGQDALMARFQPQIDQSHAALVTQLANQGIAPGSEAYNNAMRTQSQSENDLKSQAALNGINVGNQAQTQAMQMQQQALQLQTALQNQPINILNAVRAGSQVTNPTFSNVPQQATTAGADLLGAANSQQANNVGLYNSQVGSANSNNAAAAGLGSTSLMAGMMFM